MIELTQPMWLLGGLAVLGPLFAHWWANRPGPLTVFPSVELLIASQRRQSRRHAVTDAMLLMLRCAVVLLIALAFAQPTVPATSVDRAEVTDSATGEDRVIAIVLDASASMQQRVGGTTAFEITRREAEAMIRSSSSDGDRVMVILAESQPRRLWPTPTDQFAALADALAEVRVTDQRAVLDAAVRLARQIAGGHGPVQVHVFTDGQASAWQRGQAEQVRVHVHAADDPVNVAVTGMHTAPEQPIVGRPATLVVSVTNHSDAPVQTRVAVAGLTDAKPTMLNLSPRATEQATFTFTARRTDAMPFTATLTTPGDVLPVDDQATLTVEPGAAIRVAIAGDHADALARMIEPGARSPFRAIVTKAADLTRDDTDLLLLTDGLQLNAEQTAALQQRIANGVGVLILGRASGDWLWNPGVIASPMTARVRPAIATLTDQVLPAYPLTALGALAEMDFTAYTDISTTAGARVLMRFDWGSPMLVEQPFGRGRVMALPMVWDADDDAGPSATMLVPLIHELLHRLKVAEGATALTAVDRRESDLRPATFAQVDESSNGGTTTQRDADTSAVITREAIALWPWLLLGALLVLAVECVIAMAAAPRAADAPLPGREGLGEGRSPNSSARPTPHPSSPLPGERGSSAPRDEGGGA